MIRARSEILNPGDVQMSITITMSVRDWNALNDQLPNKWPSWSFSSVIGNAIRQRLGALTEQTEDESP